MMNLTRKVAVLAATLMIAVPVLAQDPGENVPAEGQVVARCLSTMGRITARHTRKTAQITRRAVFVINQLQENEEAESAANVAEASSNGVTRIGEHGAARIQEVVEACGNILTEIGAGEEAFAAIEQGAMNAGEAMQNVATEALEKIDDALND